MTLGLYRQAISVGSGGPAALARGWICLVNGYFSTRQTTKLWKAYGASSAAAQQFAVIPLSMGVVAGYFLTSLVLCPFRDQSSVQNGRCHDEDVQTNARRPPGSPISARLRDIQAVETLQDRQGESRRVVG